MFLYKILHALDLTQSFHDKNRHQNAPAGQILNLQNTFLGLVTRFE
jgi:hypothetical protein